jgi:hypothetical protein
MSQIGISRETRRTSTKSQSKPTSILVSLPLRHQYNLTQNRPTLGPMLAGESFLPPRLQCFPFEAGAFNLSSTLYFQSLVSFLFCASFRKPKFIPKVTPAFSCGSTTAFNLASIFCFQCLVSFLFFAFVFIAKWKALWFTSWSHCFQSGFNCLLSMSS